LVLLSEKSKKCLWNPHSQQRGRQRSPKAARDYLKLAPGDKVKFFLHPDGHVVILPMLPITALRGMIPLHKRKPVSIEQMDRDMIEAATERHSKKRR
jgi:bifunctional DNA-binding transcriptional regulator/antitoxin component of YhaV-PrlF toxin-antitoxin module